MNKEELIKYKKKLSNLSEEEFKARKLQYLRKLSIGELQGPPVGYASIDMPWLGYYPEEMFFERKKYNKIIDYIKDTWKDSLDDVMIHYYGSDITARNFFDIVDRVAKSLKSFGLNKGDTIITNLESVPEFIELFFACEMIGVNVKNKIGADVLEIADVINESNSEYFFAHNYISKNDTDYIYQNTLLNNIITISPVEYANNDLSSLRENIKENILSRYNTEISKDRRNINWNEFMHLGNNYVGEIYVESNENTKLFSAYTSGSTGARKEVIHSSKTFLDMLEQMIFSSHKEGKRDTWLLPTFPPSLVSIVVAFMCMPLAEGKRLILDPYAKVEDIDLEIMHYEPTCIGIVPVFFDVLLDSSRIPDDYDMSYFKIIGFGAEPMTRKYVTRVLEFMEKHNCKANFNAGYGNSEGGSEFTIAFGKDIILTGSSGFPLINTTVAIFEPGTEHELGYGEVGELCKAGPGIMIGYASDEDTAKTVRVHSDGRKWLHTGDLGYIDKDGFLFITGRKKDVIVLKNGKNVFPEEIETVINRIDGIKESFVYGKPEEDDEIDLKICSKIVYDKEAMKEIYGIEGEKEILDLVWSKIKEINKTMPNYKAIKEVAITEEELIKTTTQKIKRHEEMKKMKKMYKI